MMGVKITLEGVEVAAVAPLKITQQLTTELDHGSVTYLKTENASSLLVAPLSVYRVQIDSSEAGKTETLDFVGMDSRAVLRNEGNGTAIFKHEVALTEPSKLLQGHLIDGAGVAQPEEESERKTLYEVINRLLQITPLYDYPASGAIDTEFVLTDDSEVVKALQDKKSPEFKWNTQTTLWECLVQIGAVMDAIPRLVADDSGRLRVITFDFVNLYSDEIESIEDGYTSVSGSNVEESQYNTMLSALVENVREE